MWAAASTPQRQGGQAGLVLERSDCSDWLVGFLEIFYYNGNIQGEHFRNDYKQINFFSYFSFLFEIIYFFKINCHI